MVKIKDLMSNLRILSYWLLVIFVAYIIFELIRKLLGGSLGFEELVIGLLIANLGFVFQLRDSVNKVDAKLSGHIGWHKGKDHSI